MIGIWIMILGGVIGILGSLGLLRFPDVYTRAHAQTVCNVGGSCMVLFGVFLEKFYLFFENFYSAFSVKALFIIVFVFLTSPVATHAITRAAYKSGIIPVKSVQRAPNTPKKIKR